MLAGIYHLTIEQGATLDRTLTWTDGDGVLVDLTGYTARAQVRDGKDATSAEVDLTTENGGITLGVTLWANRLNRDQLRVIGINCDRCAIVL